MNTKPASTALSRFFSDYGMVVVLALLAAYYSFATWNEQHPEGTAAADEIAGRILDEGGAAPRRVLIAARRTSEEDAFVARLRERLAERVEVVRVVQGEPRDAREALQAIQAEAGGLDAVLATRATASWEVFDGLSAEAAAKKGANDTPARGARLITPESYWWPDFLKAGNLLNVANQIAVIAILAVGMTLVVITAGIDLSAGSLIALAAVVTTLLIRDLGSAERASAAAMTLAALGGIAVCAAIGVLTALSITLFEIPPFIVTLGMMLVASGLAYILAGGESVYQVPDSFVWLGRGADLFGLPNAVVLMLLLYAATHVLMTRTALGRAIYAVGGNREAARLSGVRVRGVILFVYTACAALAGVGGVVMASQLKSGAPTYGQMYELYVIAAVVVGGTSLAGGEGKVLGTLIGAFIIAVIQNGMNLTGIESYTQKVVLGLVILGAVLLDKLKRRGWRLARG
jgi:ribose transport system permease protein